VAVRRHVELRLLLDGGRDPDQLRGPRERRDRLARDGLPPLVHREGGACPADLAGLPPGRPRAQPARPGAGRGLAVARGPEGGEGGGDDVDGEPVQVGPRRRVRVGQRSRESHARESRATEERYTASRLRARARSPLTIATRPSATAQAPPTTIASGRSAVWNV